jgi:hypothetical protein
VPEMNFSAEQMARLRESCGLRPDDRELSAADVLAVLAAREVIELEGSHWVGSDDTGWARRV